MCLLWCSEGFNAEGCRWAKHLRTWATMATFWTCAGLPLYQRVQVHAFRSRCLFAYTMQMALNPALKSTKDQNMCHYKLVTVLLLDTFSCFNKEMVALKNEHFLSKQVLLSVLLVFRPKSNRSLIEFGLRIPLGIHFLCYFVGKNYVGNTSKCRAVPIGWSNIYVSDTWLEQMPLKSNLTSDS